MPPKKTLVPVLIAAAATLVFACSPRNDGRDQQASLSASDHRSVGEAITDAAMTASVKTSLAVERGVKASGIDVDTSNGVVTLDGMVRSGAEARLAERATRKVSGVREVVNHLRVSSS